ncbi:MAG: M28 family peptidase [Dehalococcoidales bacterium]|nr:MAG: M28 family peptidase [Dehalococcoidales bacterium]
MDYQYREMQPLKEHVKILEGKNSRARGEQIITTLSGLGIQPTFQKCPWPRITNIIVDFSTVPDTQQILFTAHYDVIKGSPGANDNASGVAVLLGLCHELRHEKAPVKIIFFDREETWFRTPVIKLGLLGSLFYISKNSMQNISAVYNLEFCGLGDSLAIWPIKNRQMKLSALHQVEMAALRLELPLKTAQIPWLFLSSDHLPFRLKGLKNALTLSLIPKDQVGVLEKSLSRVSLLKLLTGQRPTLPKPLNIIHSIADTSDNINENSLSLMLSLVRELISSYDSMGNSSSSVNEKD